ncbi:MAG TPA: DUF4255 domain-containing protein [Vicinamibacterales bacterium]|nr:DUF4255 domain-containing protein [Vicinamibacterales bacterium]
MIDLALKFLVAELNGYLLSRTGASGADLSRIVDDAGKIAIPASTLGVALVNIDEERVLKSHLPSTVLIDGRQVLLQPELKLNLTIIVAANFTKYEDALRQLSWALTFFQAHPGFTRDRFPNLDPRIERFTVELYSLTFDQLNQLWSCNGGRQLPAVVYRVRLVAVQDVEPSAIQPPVTQITAVVHGS